MALVLGCSSTTHRLVWLMPSPCLQVEKKEAAGKVTKAGAKAAAKK